MGCILQTIHEKEKTDKLVELLGIPQEYFDVQKDSDIVYDYLCSSEDFQTRKAMNEFMNRLRTFSPNAETGLDANIPDMDIAALMAEHAAEPQEKYKGTDGLRQAVIRFLSACVSGEGSELCLYSDQSMEWMQGDYAVKQYLLMRECLKRGARIRIIHNIGRKIPEMINAINFWMPLYLSGQVASYYPRKSQGERFANTLFWKEGASIRGTCYLGDEDDCIYDYHTDEEDTAFDKKTFDSILRESEPLLEYRQGRTKLSDRLRTCRFEDLEICIGKKKVVVNKLSEPSMSFVFFHELMIRAFHEYLDGREK